MKRFVLGLLTTALLGVPCWAQVFDVFPGGSIQATINIAPSGATIQVHPGTYTENIDYLNKDLDIVAVGPGVTTIQGNSAPNQNVVVRFVGGQTSAAKLRGFMIRGGNSSFGGGIRCIGSSPTISDNVIQNNSADLGGGLYLSDSDAVLTGNSVQGNDANLVAAALYATQSSPVITGNTFDGNVSFKDVSGLYLRGASKPLITGNVISNNLVFPISGTTIGGALMIDSGCLAVIERNVIVSNTSSGDVSNGAGGIYCLNISGSPAARIRMNDIRLNYTGASGGGILVRLSSDILIENNRVRDNTSVDYGGGIACDGQVASTVIIRNNQIDSNEAFDGGGGLSCRDDAGPLVEGNVVTSNGGGVAGGGVFVEDSSPNLIENEIVENGTVAVGGGVAWFGSGSGMTTSLIDKNLVSDNSATGNGAGLYLEDTAGLLLLTNNMIVLNVLTPASGGNAGAGVYCLNAPDTFTNNTVADNVTGPGDNGPGGGLYVSGASGPVINNCIFWSNSSTSELAFVPMINHCDVGPVPYTGTGIGNINANPWIFGAPMGNYHLTAGSPCIDAAWSTAPGVPSDDFDSQARVAPMDIGADEYYPYTQP